MCVAAILKSFNKLRKIKRKAVGLVSVIARNCSMHLMKIIAMVNGWMLLISNVFQLHSSQKTWRARRLNIKSI
jgi:hypothetical protein